MRKPDPAIFTHALDLLGLDPSEAIAYVGDTIYNDVRGAEAAGLTPLLHDPRVADDPLGRHRQGRHALGRGDHAGEGGVDDQWLIGDASMGRMADPHSVRASRGRYP